MENRHIIYVDMDGVLVDFLAGVIEIFGLENKKELAYSGVRVEKLMGITKEEFAVRLDNVDIWKCMPKTPECDDLIERLSSFAEDGSLCILSHPLNASAITGKMDWLNKYLPGIPSLFGRKKYMCAHNRAILIDDYDGNIKDFNERGGNGILYPRPWNSGRVSYDILVKLQVPINEYVVAEIEKIQETFEP